MRQPVTAARVNEFMKALGDGVSIPARVFLVGGASAVLLGWREATIDIDLKAIPDRGEIVRELSALKERLEINIELASPGDFIPELPGWQDRSQFVAQVGKVTFLHYDFYAQALAKLERSHERDLSDVDEMSRRNLIEPRRLLEFFERIEDDIQNYPSLDAASFRRKVESFLNRAQQG